MKKTLNDCDNISDVIVLSTSIQTAVEVQFLAEILNKTAGITDWSIDLDDYEKILRIVSTGITISEAMRLLSKAGIQSKPLAVEN